jgi:hypothetical protein
MPYFAKGVIDKTSAQPQLKPRFLHTKAVLKLISFTGNVSFLFL